MLGNHDARSALPSGELEESRAAEFTRHIEGCSDCVGRLEQQMEQHGEMDARMREMDVRVREMVPDHPDTAALERRIRSRIAAAARAQRIRRWSIAAGVLLAVLGLRVFLMNRVPRVCADAAEDHRGGEVIGKERRNWIADPAALSVLARRVGLESLDSAGAGAIGISIRARQTLPSGWPRVRAPGLCERERGGMRYFCGRARRAQAKPGHRRRRCAANTSLRFKPID